VKLFLVHGGHITDICNQLVVSPSLVNSKKLKKKAPKKALLVAGAGLDTSGLYHAVPAGTV